MLSKDLIFKYVFSHEEILKDFIDSFLKYNKINKTFSFTSVVPQNCIMPNNRKAKIFLGDIVGVLEDGNIVSLEMYNNKFSKREYKKSIGYMCRLCSNQIDKKEKKYEEMKKVISINLIRGNFRGNKEIINSYKLKEERSGKVIDEGDLEMHLIRFDIRGKKIYNEGEERLIKWLDMINARSIEEMEEIGRNDRKMEKVIKYVKEWVEKSNENALENYIEEKEYEAKEEGINDGKKYIALK